jgi:membrane carboxypeptidase/penicillin-binding protein
VLFQANPKGSQAISPKVAHAATNVLEGVISQGTATAANIGRPAAGKTGTSQNNRDCWFVGYTPQLVTSVWVGYTPERTVEVRGSKGFGGTVAAPIWARFMRSALAGQPKKDFAWASNPRYSGGFDIPVSYETLHPPAPKVTTPPAKKVAKTSPKKSKKKPKKKSGGGTGGGGGGSTPTTSTP